MSTPKFLWICPKNPDGAPDGSRIASRSLLKGLQALGTETHLLITTEEVGLNESQINETLKLASTRVLVRPRPILRSTPRLRGAMTLKTFEHPELREKVAQAIQTVQPTHIVFDGLHSAATVPMIQYQKLRDRGIKLIYRAQSIESLLWSQTANIQKSRLLHVFLVREADIIGHFEDLVVDYVDATAAVSEADVSSLRDRAPKAKVECVPIGLEFPQSGEPINEEAGIHILFVGALTSKSNKIGLDWFFDQVWSRVSRRDLTLHVAGEGAKLLDTHGNSVVIHGQVSNLAPLYQRSHLTIAPMLTGSGTRVKVIESTRFGRATLGTPLGMMGLPLVDSKSAWIEKDAEKWVQILDQLTLDQCRIRGQAAFESLKEQFELKSCANRFMKLALQGS